MMEKDSENKTVVISQRGIITVWNSEKKGSESSLGSLPRICIEKDGEYVDTYLTNKSIDLLISALNDAKTVITNP